MVVSGSWGLRSYYLAPLALLLAIAIAGGGAVAIALASVAAVVGAVRAIRIAVVVTGDRVLVRNFWSSYRFELSDVVAAKRARSAGWFGMVRWPHSVIELDLGSGTQIRVLATSHASIWGERSGNAA